MEYKFFFRNGSDDLSTYTCEAENFDDALTAFAKHIITNKLSVYDLEYYYVVSNGRKRKRAFDFRLRNKFFEFFRIIFVMDKVYGVDK